MPKYCVTAANRTNPGDDRVSEFKVWQLNAETNEWNRLGKKTADFVSKLLVEGNSVVSGTENVKNGKVVSITPGAAIEITHRIAKNDKNFKITDFPEF